MSQQTQSRVNLRQSFSDIAICQKLFFSDLGTCFVSELLIEVTKLLKIHPEHASLKHLQTVSVVEHSHRAVKRFFKLNNE